MSDPQPAPAGRSSVLWRYAAATGLALLLNEAGFLASISYAGVVTPLYAGAVCLTGSLVLLLLAFVPVAILHRLLPRDGDPARLRWSNGVVYGLAVATSSVAQGFVLMDRYVYGIYGFHLNGFVWNLVTTKGGVNSMAAGASTMMTFVLIAASLVAIQAGLLVAVLKIPRLRRLGEGMLNRRRIAALLAAFLALVAFDKVTYGVSYFRSYGPVLGAAGAFPLYLPVTFSTFLRRLGFNDEREAMIHIDPGSSRLNYPLRPIELGPSARPLNIVWLVSESLRWDMLDGEIMPATWAFAGKSTRFTRHYSGGNGTRMGMFSMFYGLPGNYFQPCLSELRSPVLMDSLQSGGYQLFLYTSAEFSFPELDKTVFAKVPRALLHEGVAPERWARDRENVSKILEAIDGRDPAKPFFTFMFFESPHAPYNFPEETVIRRPYTRELNYLTMDLKKDIGTIKNSYINACRHLDTQLERVIRHLEEKRLLDSTLVLVTGDHGEEFMEKGRWGHHSAFSEEQTRVPLVLHVPGRAPAVVDRMTSHLDLPATVLALLGAKNAPEDYSLGVDLLGGVPREFLVLSGWSELAYVDEHFKAVFPLKAYDVVHRPVTTRDDGPADPKAFMAEAHERLGRMMRELKRFQK